MVVWWAKYCTRFVLADSSATVRSESNCDSCGAAYTAVLIQLSAIFGWQYFHSVCLPLCVCVCMCWLFVSIGVEVLQSYSWWP